MSRSDFALYRIVPTASWATAGFLLEDEQRNRLGSYLPQSRVRADLLPVCEIVAFGARLDGYEAEDEGHTCEKEHSYQPQAGLNNDDHSQG